MLEMYFFNFASCEPLKHFNLGKALYSINSCNTIQNGFKTWKVKVSQNQNKKSQIPQNVTIVHKMLKLWDFALSLIKA